MQPLRSSAEPTTASRGRHHCSRRIAALRFFRSQRTRRRIPRVRFLRNQITSVLPRFPRIEGNRGGANRTPFSRSTASDATVTPCPVHLPRRRTRENALSIRWEARHGQSRFVLRGDSGHGSRDPETACISTWRHRLRSRELESVQLRLRLRLVPLRPRCDVLQLRVKQVVQELPLRILHCRLEVSARCARSNCSRTWTCRSAPEAEPRPPLCPREALKSLRAELHRKAAPR